MTYDAYDVALWLMLAVAAISFWLGLVVLAGRLWQARKARRKWAGTYTVTVCDLYVKPGDPVEVWEAGGVVRRGRVVAVDKEKRHLRIEGDGE